MLVNHEIGGFNCTKHVTRTGSRGWQARLTIGFFRSVFIFVGAFPPSTVPTTSQEEKWIRNACNKIAIQEQRIALELAFDCRNIANDKNIVF